MLTTDLQRQPDKPVDQELQAKSLLNRHVHAKLKAMRNEFELLKDVSRNLNIFTGFLENSLLNSSRLGEEGLLKLIGNPPRLHTPTAKIFIKKFESNMKFGKERGLNAGLDIMKRCVPLRLVAVMTEEMSSLSRFRLTLKHVLDHWNVWDVDRISSGLEAANIKELEAIDELVQTRHEEHQIILYEFRQVGTSALEFGNRNLIAVLSEVDQCKDDEAALEKFLRAFDWEGGTLDKSHLISIVNSLFLCKLRTGLREYLHHRLTFRTFIERGVTLSEEMAICKTRAETTIYLGPYPSFRTLNNNIMKIPCIASCVLEKDESGTERWKSGNGIRLSPSARPFVIISDRKRKRGEETEKETETEAEGSSSGESGVRKQMKTLQELVEERRKRARS
ncbi:hypothetical protein EG329_008219 [Mollisiaceae sp. DMI_Dod_QoI]|nr:hypothetical protein EG329_008219 [Helotiales sp. DMI_Dod_QoI]